MELKLSTLAVALGVVVTVVELFALLQPARFKTFARQFPRSLPWGYTLMVAGTVWFVVNVTHESLSDFEPLKPVLTTLFIGVGLGSCFFVHDFLAVRGAAVLMLLVGKLMVDTERWSNSEWRLVIALWAYLLVVAGMWFTISPWRMHDLIQWGTATDQRIRLLGAVRGAFGVFVIILGLTKF